METEAEAMKKASDYVDEFIEEDKSTEYLKVIRKTLLSTKRNIEKELKNAKKETLNNETTIRQRFLMTRKLEERLKDINDALFCHNELLTYNICMTFLFCREEEIRVLKQKGKGIDENPIACSKI